MSFTNILARRFSNSTVHQVGFDGENDLSIRLYGNGSPVLFRDVQELVQVEPNTAPLESPYNRRALINSGYKAELFEDGLFENFITLIITLVIPIFGPLYWFKNAILNLFRTNTYFLTFEQKPIHVNDKRYETGISLEGYKKIPVYSTSAFESSTAERLIFIGKGISNLGIAVLIIVFHYYIYQNWH